MKNKIIYSAIFLISLLAISLLLLPQNKNISDIMGTYISEENPRNWISFDLNSQGEFYYYFINNANKQIEARGTFLKQQNGEYKVDCKTLSIGQCKLNGKKLTINIDGNTYLYIKNSSTPTIILMDNPSSLEHSKSEYLSITYTQYKDRQGPENGMGISFIQYDIPQKKLTEIFNADYSSQYPLGIISQSDHKVYYTAESVISKGMDELFSYDILTKKVKQLTDGLFAINKILSRENELIIIGVKRGTSAIRLIKYDKKTGALIYNHLEDDDTCVENASLNINDNRQLYTVTYSDDSRRKSSELQALGKADHYIIPNYTILRYDSDISKPIQTRTVENRIVRSLSVDGNILLTKEVDSLERDTYKVYIEDLKNKKKTPLEIEGIAKCKDLQIDRSGKHIYFIGILNHSDERSLFCYDMESKTLETIFTPDKGIGFINNFLLMYE